MSFDCLVKLAKLENFNGIWPQIKFSEIYFYIMERRILVLLLLTPK